jgi:hypothetical protein
MKIIKLNRVEATIQERINSVLGMLPNWLYFLTSHGRTFQRYLDIVHALPLKVITHYNELKNNGK